MKSMLAQICFLLMTLPLSAVALPGDNCPAEQIVWGPWMFNRQFTMADGCLVQATPIHKSGKKGLVYREYVFDESGRFMVFNSTDGDYETATAQRNFILLPAVRPPEMKVVGDQMRVTLASGHEVQFRKDSAFVQSSGVGLVVRDLEKVDLTAGGNFQILSYDGVLLDTGWMVGGRSSRRPEAESQFSIPGEPACKVSNQEIFLYHDPVTREEYYQPLFKYSDPRALEAFLVARCGY